MTPLPLSNEGAPEDGPWEANLCFTVEGANQDDVQRKMDRIQAAAKRAGVTAGFSDYAGPLPEDKR